jgi:hypothetical protein
LHPLHCFLVHFVLCCGKVVIEVFHDNMVID